jgi:hypothetical protein
MEFNHQVGLCRALPVSFSGTAPSLTLVASGIEEMRAAILRVPFHKVPPPKESMKEFLENRGLKRAYWLRRAPLQILSNRGGTCGN